MVSSAVLGFPRIGANRQVKKAVEAYWSDKISAEELLKTVKEIRLGNYKTIKDAGVDIIPSGDFTLYDHVLDHSVLFGIVPEKYTSAKLTHLDLTFALGRGRQRDGVDLPAQEMQKWFDSNYHYIVPELAPSTTFSLGQTGSIKQVEQYKEAKEAGFETRPVILGPITYLLIAKASPALEAAEQASFKPISLLDKFVPVYVQLLEKLQEAGATSVQIDEPALVMDSTAELGAEYEKVYKQLAEVGLDITLATYFGRLDSNIDYVAKLPISTLHIDLDRAPEQFEATLAALKDTKLGLSLGVVSGRNIWKNDFAKSIGLAQKAIETLGAERVIIATSSSLLHTPVTLANEKKLTAEQKDWFSFATEKCSEVAVIAKAVSGKATEVAEALEANKASIKARRDFEQTSDSAVRTRVAEINDDQLKRRSAFPERRAAQNKVHPLPKFPTTTIGSFPQTKEIRQARAKFTKKEITAEQYDDFIAKEIETVVRFQEKIGLDLLVHGEPERNDMVQYFGEQLSGFVFTENAWVQSYGSRYVRPPIIVSDVSRPNPMTIRWSSYAQTLSKQPVKGMLTGPITCLQWSFPRADIDKKTQAYQLALALRDEVLDLEKAGIFAIQVDEPALREGLPLRKADWDACVLILPDPHVHPPDPLTTNSYLTWAVDSFRLSTAGVRDETQTHSHFCYSDFNLIFKQIERLDADVISIEASKSSLKILDIFSSNSYPRYIGPGVYDIHSPRVPPQQEIQDRIAAMLQKVPADLLVVNPDCGLKTRGWKETEASLTNLVEAAKWARQTYQ